MDVAAKGANVAQTAQPVAVEIAAAKLILKGFGCPANGQG